MSEAKVINLEQNKYIHVLDTLTNVQRLECGPKKFIQQDHELIATEIRDFIMLKPRNYCVIKNPVIRNEKEIQYTKFKNGAQCASVRFGEIEIRKQEDYQDPFPLYPLEEMSEKPQEYKKVNQNTALLIKAIRPFTDEKAKEERFIDDEYLFIGGAGFYIPRIEEQVIKEIQFPVIKPQSAIVVKAKKNLTDCTGKERTAGQRWLVRKQGAYQPHVNEDVLETRKAYILTDKKCIHLRALKDMVDYYGNERRAGSEWLIGIENTETHILDVNEEFVKEVFITSLTNRQYCYIINPVESRVQQFGIRVLRKGELKFFLQPGEVLENNKIYDAIVLGEDQALLLKTSDLYKDDDGTQYQPGSIWMKNGPCDFIPKTMIQVIEIRKSFPLDKNEGIYIRDKQSGEVRLIKGQEENKQHIKKGKKKESLNKNYMLEAYEELWEKQLSDVIERLISEGQDQMEYERLLKVVAKKRDKTKAVTFKPAKGTAVQLFDYKEGVSRIVFGPELIMLRPYEEISVIPLSGGYPVAENKIRALSLELGPSQIRDQIIVETVDHAKLILDLSYNWEFRTFGENYNENMIFQNKDYLGMACKAMLSRIRGIISTKTFDEFHKGAHGIIKHSILKQEKPSDPLIPFKFPENNLFITDINSSGYRPVDKETEESLQRSFKLSLDIQTRSKEMEAQHQQDSLDQTAKGRLDIQIIEQEKERLVATKQLLIQEAETEFLKKQETEIANTKARAAARKIEGEGLVSQAENKVKALAIQRNQEISLKQSRQDAEMSHQEALDNLEINTSRELAEIEVNKFKLTIEAIGRQTIVEMARAGPEMQAKLLKGLGLQGFMVMDGKHPINLFSTANGMVSSTNMIQTSQVIQH